MTSISRRLKGLPPDVAHIASKGEAEASRYNLVARIFHWTIMLLIACMFLTNWLRADAPHASTERSGWLSAHESLGLLVLALSLGRLAWRLTHAAPPLHGSPLVRHVVGAGHALLYLATIGLPLAGLARAFAANELGFLGIDVPPSTERGHIFTTIADFLHGGLVMDLLLALIAGHALAALWHQFVLKDGTLRRMI